MQAAQMPTLLQGAGQHDGPSETTMSDQQEVHGYDLG